jgi:hypothetical protein
VSRARQIHTRQIQLHRSVLLAAGTTASRERPAAMEMSHITDDMLPQYARFVAGNASILQNTDRPTRHPTFTDMQSDFGTQLSTAIDASTGSRRLKLWQRR